MRAQSHSEVCSSLTPRESKASLQACKPSSSSNASRDSFLSFSKSSIPQEVRMRMGMQYQQKPLPGQAMALAAGHSSSAGFYAGAEGIAASNISTVLLLLQLALPVLLLAGLCMVLMFSAIRKVGDKMGGWSTLDDDDDDILLPSVKAKKARQRGRREAKQAMKTRPRKTLILLSFFILAVLSSMEEGLLLIISAVGTGNSARLAKEQDTWSLIGSVLAYAAFSLNVAATPRNEIAGSMLFKIAAGLSVAFNVAGLACMLASAFLVRSPGALHIALLVFQGFKVVASSILATAYCPKFREPVPPDVELCDEEESSAEVHSSTSALIVNASDSESDGDDDDDDDEIEEEAKKRSTVADWPSIMLRFKRLLPMMFPHPSFLSYGLIVTCVILSLISVVASTLEPRQFGIIVNDLVSGRPPWHSLLVWGVLRFASRGGLTILRASLWYPVAGEIQRNTDRFTFEHVLGLGMLYHSNKRTGELLSILSRGGSSVSGVLDFLLFSLAPTIFNIAGSLSLLASHFGPELICIIGITGVLYIAVMEVSRSKTVALGRECRQRSDNTAAIKNEGISNVELLKYLGMEAYEVNRYSNSLVGLQKAEWESGLYDHAAELLQNSIQVAGTLMGSAWVADQVYEDKINVGIFVMYLTYASSILGNLDSIRWMSIWINRLMMDTEKVFDILEEKNEIEDAEDAEELYECRGDIDFENVTLIYPESKGKKKTSGKPRKALDNVSFTVSAGQHVALVGETGAGKSTIFKALYRFFECQEGSVKVDGKDIRHITQRSLRQALGVVQQEGSVLNDSIFANIKYGDIIAPDEKVLEAAKMAQLHDKVMEWPKKYQTVVGERGVKLSGGEKQRVNIARTILKNPKILLLDEATSALDSNTEKAIQSQLRRLTRGKTTLAIAHRLSTIAHADKIIVLDKGKIVETGTHEELISIKDGFYKKLWETQTSGGKVIIDEEASMEREGETLALANTD